MIAAPYKVKEGEWGTDKFALKVDFYSSLPNMQNIYLYHSKDNQWVSFTHMNQWSEKIANSVVR